MMIAFAGEVRCQYSGAALNLSLHGRSPAAGPTQTSCDTDILFAGANTPSLPDRLHEVRVIELDCAAGALRRFRVESTELQLQFEARSVQIHRCAGTAMFAAIPPPHVPWHVRAGVSLLVSVLAIPAVASLLLRRRGAA